MTTFTIHTVESAPAEVQEVLETVEKDNNGYIPNLIGLLANAPTALEAYRTVGAINRRNSLTPVEREVVQITAAVICTTSRSTGVRLLRRLMAPTVR